MFNSILAVAIGSALGALLRWLASIKLNPLYPALPLGTLTVNVVGGYLIGIAVAVFTQRAEVAPEVRLLVITGFLGGLTTFSTFSAEVVGMLMQNRLGSAFAIVMMHVGGSLLMTWLGMQTAQAFAR